MSLENAPARYALGVIASKDFDSRDLLDELFGPKLAQIRHLYTNGANALVTDFARENGLPCTVFPIAGGRGLPASTRDIVESCDVVIIIASAESKSANQVAEICAERAARQKTAGEEVLKWRKVAYEPIDHWREKVGKVAEVLACMTKDDLAENGWSKAVWEVVS